MTKLRLVLAACAMFYAVFILRTLFRVDGRLYSTLFDDAMISMRYARNAAAGAGLVWNAGGERVQGYTNPLWTFMMTGIHAVGIPPRLTSLVVMLMSAAILAALTVAVYRLARRMAADDRTALAAATLTGFCYPIVYWSLRGMEVGCLALLLVIATAATIDVARGAGARQLSTVAIALTAALWTRPDALVAGAVIGLYLVFVAPARWRAITVAAAAVALVGVAGPLIFGRLYYGSALPNTYYLKVAGIPVLARVQRGFPALITLLLRGLAAFLLPAAALLTGVGRGLRRSRRELMLIAAIVAAQCGYSVSVGGDAWEWMGYANRYIATVLPLAAVLVACGLGGSFTQTERRWMVTAFLVLFALHAVLLVYLLHANRAVDRAFVDAFTRHQKVVVGAIAAGAMALSAFAAFGFSRASYAMTCVFLWIVLNGLPVGRWIADNAMLAPEDERAAREGLLFHNTLAPDATFEVSWAGSTPYFAERTAIDLLGKNDAVIAHLPPVISEFVPGHNRWNLHYSIGGLRPDLACDLPRRPGDVDYLTSLGYRSIGGTCFIRPGARLHEAPLVDGLAGLYGSRLPAAGSETR